MYKQILIATDGSELAGRAVAHGLALAKEVKAPVNAFQHNGFWLDVGRIEDFQKAQDIEWDGEGPAFDEAPAVIVAPDSNGSAARFHSAAE